ncbi:cadherin-like beta sandwich domain-containing protein [Paenibacillus koleovorans]|uniref:cadherin-like beta sandwich domain-containing protein n=1 Tax=Paenibacillus koleovorans TaxID=121608 RepID=UPI000FDBE00D|nr:cadherin-like beta sandwich domain-containing protein [Paenibacillus koleovorans]
MIKRIGLENASVLGGNRVGALVGSNTGIVMNTYAKGSVNGVDSVGGLIGQNSYSVSNSYSTALVSGTTHVGGLIGNHTGGTVTNAYWDTETSGLSISGSGTGHITADMQQSSTYSSWTDFSIDWNMMDGTTYPMFVTHFSQARIPTIVVTPATGTVSWASASFSSSIGAYELNTDRYIETVHIDASTLDSSTTVTIGAVASRSTTVPVRAGGNEVWIRTTPPEGDPQGVYRLNITVPPPAITHVDVPTPQYYGVGDTMTFTVSYEGNVDVVNSPRIPIAIGTGASTSTVYADFTGKPVDQPNKLTFTYVVQEGLSDADGIEIGPGIDLPAGAAIYAASTLVAAPLVLPVTTTNGIRIDSTKPSLTLSQHPDDTVATNGPVTITVNADGTGTNVVATKWSQGLRSTDYFATDGQSFTGGSFLASVNGTYTVYVEDEVGNSNVASITIGNIVSDSPQISLSYSPTSRNPSVTVNVMVNVQGNGNSITHLNWLDGSRSAADFADGANGTDILSTRSFTVTANGTYTLYVKDAVDNEAVEEITLSNIGSTIDSTSSGGEDSTQPAPNVPKPQFEIDVSGGVMLQIDPLQLVKVTHEDGTIIEQIELTD